MIVGSKTFAKPAFHVIDRLKMILAAASCRMQVAENGRLIRFEHGTWMTQTATMLPKSGAFRISESNGDTRVDYAIQASGFVRALYGTLAVLFFWTVFTPILVYRLLSTLPRQFAENTLAGV